VVRGHRLEEVANRSFEWLLTELWRDLVPDARDEDRVRRELGRARVRAAEDLKPLFAFARGMSPISALQLFVASVPDTIWRCDWSRR
jgi:citrate synthase